MKKIFLPTFTLLLLTNVCKAQTLAETLFEDEKIKLLIEQKRKLNNKITINDQYKIQIYHGNAEGAKKALADFTILYDTIDATTVFSTPNYKVWVGSFKNRIEANKALIDIKKHFDRALIIRPNK